MRQPTVAAHAGNADVPTADDSMMGAAHRGMHLLTASWLPPQALAQIPAHTAARRCSPAHREGED